MRIGEHSVLLETWGASALEIASDMLGDELIVAPSMSATRSIDLGAGPSEVFGWLTQMGFGRAGWYSYDLIDNLGRRSARRIVPQWQVRAAGETVPGGPMVSFSVAVYDPHRAFVLAVLDRRLLGHRIDFTLAYRLDTPGGGRAGTRLVSRARASVVGPLGRPASWLLGIGDGLMVRRQLLGLRDRCG